MRFFLIFIALFCTIPSFIAGIVQPKHLEKSPFLQRMLTEQQPATDTTQKKSPTKEVKANKPTIFKKFIGLVCESISYCGGKKIWYKVMPKHIRKLTFLGSFRVLDGTSFMLGSLLIYTSCYIFLNKKAIIMERCSLALATLGKLFNRQSVPSTINDKPAFVPGNDFLDEKISPADQDDNNSELYTLPHFFVKN
ncbi:MAG TPA: hypothetical protein VL201_03155 [Patescibacteria group bacterium]|jgi:hypothetical protein|nr:hypothetical protein [Patescibacteria group bacterium]